MTSLHDPRVHEQGVAAVDGIGRDRGTRSEVLILRADGRRAPPGPNRRGRPRPRDSWRGVDTPGRWSRGPAGPESTTYSNDTSPVAVAVRRRVVADGGAGVSSRAETDTVEAVVAEERIDRGVGCAMVVAAARAPAEPVPPSMGMSNTEAKTVSTAGEIDPRPVQPSAGATKAETWALSLLGGAGRASILIRGGCVRKS